MIDIERRGDLAILRMSRLDTHNAMDDGFLTALAETTREVGTDRSVRAVVLTGGEKAFCVGGDLQWITRHPRSPGAAVHDLAGKLHAAVVEIRRMEKAVVAAVRGVAAGAGMSLALGCDLRVLGHSTRLVMAYTSRGLSPDGGGSFWLPRLVGLARALEIAALDEPISARDALAWGLATRVVDDEVVLDEAISLAEELAKRSPHAFGAAKQLLVDSFATPLEVQLENERRSLARCADHPDGREGLDAFTSKREPVFRSGR